MQAKQEVLSGTEFKGQQELHPSRRPNSIPSSIQTTEGHGQWA